MRLTASMAMGALCNRVQVEEFAPRMRPARGLDDRSWLARRMVELTEAGIRICLHQAGIVGQMLLGMLAASVGRVEEGQHGRARDRMR